MGTTLAEGDLAVASSKPKTLYLAESSLVSLLSSGTCYYWTLTAAKNVESKADAEAMAKPLWDKIRRLGGRRLHFWERQERGAWHVHFITDIYLDVRVLRPWLVARGWGPQMRADKVRPSAARWNGDAWASDTSNFQRLIRYLQKYVTKSITDDNGKHLKPFGGSRSAKTGNCRFNWAPWIHPGSYLYAMGMDAYQVLYGHSPKLDPTIHRDTARLKSARMLMHMGVLVTNWLDVDPWYDDS